MSEMTKKAATQAVQLARRKAAAHEVIGLVTKAAAIGHQRKQARAALSRLLKTAGKKSAALSDIAAPGLPADVQAKMKAKKKMPAGPSPARLKSQGTKKPPAPAPAMPPKMASVKVAGKPWVPPKPYDQVQKPGWTPPKPYDPVQKPGWTPPKPYDPVRVKAAPRPAMPAKPAVPAPLPSPLAKASAERLMLGLLVKAAGRLKHDRATTYTKAAKAYAVAVKSGNKEHIKKAVAHLAGVMTFDSMTKSAVTAEVGSAIMRLISKLTPYLGTIAGKTKSPGFGQFAERGMQWGEQLGQQG